jgi:glycosyltransferase involved in cell wall biosynthesis
MSDVINSIFFNYIITIHNKENLIENVILSVIKCMNKNSILYAVLDGCSDNSEKIIDGIIFSFPESKIIKVYENDVHELKAINAGLRASKQEGRGYNIILQDDVVLTDFNIESRIIQLYNIDNNLGVISLRHGSDFSRFLINKKAAIFPVKNYIESVSGHNPSPNAMLPLGYFTYREVAIKSPIVISFDVVRNVGLPDERFAPWDDIAYCYTVNKSGYNNGVYAVDFKSEVSWGTTRLKTQKVSISAVQKRNITLFKTLYGNQVKAENKKKVYTKRKIKIFEYQNQKTTLKQYFKGFKSFLFKKTVHYAKMIIKR